MGDEEQKLTADAPKKGGKKARRKPKTRLLTLSDLDQRTTAAQRAVELGVVLKAAFGHQLTDDEASVFASVAGNRNPPERRVRELWSVIGRRSGPRLSLAEAYRDRFRAAAGQRIRRDLEPAGRVTSDSRVTSDIARVRTALLSTRNA